MFRTHGAGRGVALLVAVAALLSGAPAHADDEYLGRVESMDSPVSGLGPSVYSSLASAAAAVPARHRSCTPASSSMSTTDKLVGDVYYDFAASEIKVNWSMSDVDGRKGGGTAKVGHVPSSCNLRIDAEMNLLDSTWWCVKSDGSSDNYEHSNDASAATSPLNVPGTLLGVRYLRPQTLGAPCYRLQAIVRARFIAKWRTSSDSGPVGLGCLERQWKVLFAPRNVSADPTNLWPSIDWLSVSPATAEKACARASS